MWQFTVYHHAESQWTFLMARTSNPLCHLAIQASEVFHSSQAEFELRGAGLQHPANLIADKVEVCKNPRTTGIRTHLFQIIPAVA